MESLLVIGWFIWLLVSLFFILGGVGSLALSLIRPDLKQKHDLSLAILVMVIYTACVLAHPFK